MTDKIKKILIFTGKGTSTPYILDDCDRAFKKIGCLTAVHRLKQKPVDVAPVIESFRPDFIFSIDHAGIDESILEKYDLNAVSWFVDNPLYFVNEKNRSERVFYLVTDRSYIPVLKKYGFDKVFYLPLATNIMRMRRSMRAKKRLGGSNLNDADVSFIATLGKRREEWKKERLQNLSPEQGRLMDEVVEEKIRDMSMTFTEILEKIERRLGLRVIDSLSMEQRGALELRIDMETSAYWREKYPLALAGHRVRIYGDEEWKKVIPESFNFGGRIDYEKDAGAVYSASKVNLNVTRTQIQTGVNQRVLDAAALGAVFLTDFRETTQEFFDCDISRLVYKDESELKEKAAHLIESEKERKDIGRKLFQSVYRRHTYEIRMKELLEVFEKNR